ncbi:hypothetical protein M1439_00415 [Candidatus Marsarchaeota archaeon]|jgi:hypothetical protein|nr:hypothetical protein [Candidatus Marsarchaeota archaeon]MCL5092279.1 hypothetical protein [Candidatus Marsarchaeota archaeon]
MGLWDKVKETGKTIGQKAGQGAKAISDEIARRQEEGRLKDKLLSNFSIEDLKGFCKFYGYSKPDPTYEDENGRTRHRKPDREDWVDLCKEKSIDKLRKYAAKNRQLSQDARETLIEIDRFQEGTVKSDTTYTEPKAMTEDKTDVNNSKPNTSDLAAIPDFEFSQLLSYIEIKYQKIINDATFSDEDGFTDNLVSSLRSAFPEMQIENTRRLHRDTGDIFVNGKYVFELKYADNEGTLNKGLQEAIRYKEKNYPGVAFIILDIGEMQGRLTQYKRWYEGNNAKVIILAGKGERKRPKKTYIFREK